MDPMSVPIKTSVEKFRSAFRVKKLLIACERLAPLRINVILAAGFLVEKVGPGT